MNPTTHNQMNQFHKIKKMEIVKVLRWKIFPIVICFYVAYLLANFPFWCIILIGIGMLELISTYYHSFTVNCTFPIMFYLLLKPIVQFRS